ncbi:integral membrane protein TerC [Pseudomonas putida]|nr:integral membrane protein TerC [Pseudomonas putida]AJG14589.1 integral membrane protein TerC [Pseudomonas plecoglossicida]
MVGRCGGGHGGGGGRHGRSSSGEREQGICRRRVASARFACLTPNRQPLSRFGHPGPDALNSQAVRVPCGSGFTREESSAVHGTGCAGVRG